MVASGPESIRRIPEEKGTMEAPISPGRRTLLKAGALTLATPVIGAVAQAAASHQEATTFDLWVISDSHVGTDKAVSAGIQHGLVGFKPPPVYPESLAEALRQSEKGGAFGGPPTKATPKNSRFGICDFTGIGCLADSRVRGERLYRDDDRRIIPARPV